MPRNRRPQNRSLYNRVPNAGSFRVNAPGGFLSSFPATPWNGDPLAPGAHWMGSDFDRGTTSLVPLGPWADGYGSIGPPGDEDWGPYVPTAGSPLTEPVDRRRSAAGWDGGGHWLPAITRCLTVITEAVVRTRWAYTAADGTAMPRPLWIDDPMLIGRAPGPIGPVSPLGRRLGGHQFFTSLLSDAILFGQGGFVFVENASGEPVPGTLMLLNPFMFWTDPATGHIFLDRDSDDPLKTDFDGRFQLNGQTWRVAKLEGLYPSHEGWPSGVLDRHRFTFGLGVRIGRYLSDSFRSAVPSGYLSVSTPNYGDREIPDPDRPGEYVMEQELLRRRWMEAHGRGRRSVAVLNSTVQYTPLAISPLDADAAKVADANLRDVAHAFGLSSIWLDQGVGGLNYCVDDETEVYTQDRGWVTRHDLSVGDVVMTLDHESGLTEWQPVSAVNVFDVENEPVVEYSSAYHSSVTTLAHRWPVLSKDGFREWTTTGEGFDVGQSIQLAAPMKSLPSEAKYTDSFVELVAWFYTEGYWTGGARDLAYIGQSHAKNPDECARIIATLTDLYGPPSPDMRNGGGVSWYRKDLDDSGHNCGMSSFRLSRGASAPLLDLVGADKIVPFDFIDSLTKAQLELFLEVSVLADGHHGASGDRALFQKRWDMAAAFDRAAILAGYAPSVSEGDHQFRVGLPLRKSLKMRGQRVSVRLLTGTVWCPTTPNGTWLARRRNKPFFTGNSNASERRADLVAMTAAGWGERMSDLVSSLLPYGSRSTILWPTFVSPSIETLTPSVVALVQNGIYTAQEGRQLLGMIPWTGPDPAFRDMSKAATDTTTEEANDDSSATDAQ